MTTLVSAARAKLLAALQEHPGLIGADAPGGEYADGWVFPTTDGQPLRAVKGTGLASVAISSGSPWAVGRNTMATPTLNVLIYADTTWTDGTPAGRLDAEDRARTVAGIVDRTFHDAANRDHLWNAGTGAELRVISCRRWGGPDFFDVPGSNYEVRANLHYEVALDGWS